MSDKLSSYYKASLWEIYARAISLVSIVGIVAVVVIGGYDLVEIAAPQVTMNAKTYEKYQSDEAYTKFGAMKKNLSAAQVTQERKAFYAQALNIERKQALQSLTRVGLGLLAIALLNLLLVINYRRRKK